MFEPLAKKPIEVVFPRTGVFVLESRHDRSFGMNDTRHDFPKVLYVFAGEGKLRTKELVLPLHTGDVVWVPAGMTHRIEDVTPLSLYAVCLRPTVYAALPSVGGELGKLRAFQHATWATDLRGLIRQLLHEQTLQRPGSEALTMGLAWQVIGLFMRTVPAPGRSAEVAGSGLARARVAAYAQELERSFFEERGIDGVAVRLGLSRRRFTQLFRVITGRSWLEEVRRLRLGHARKLLRETGRSVVSICYECGFEDLSNFYRAFRSAEGTSPDAWRKNNP